MCTLALTRSTETCDSAANRLWRTAVLEVVGEMGLSSKQGDGDPFSCSFAVRLEGTSFERTYGPFNFADEGTARRAWHAITPAIQSRSRATFAVYMRA